MIVDDIHYSNKRLVAIKKRLAGFERNGKMAVRFVDAMTAYGITAIRVSSLGWHAWKMISMIEDGMDVKDMTRQDIEKIVSEMTTFGWKNDTIKMFVLTLKRLVTYAKTGKILNKNYDTEDDYDEAVRWVNASRYMKKEQDSVLENRKGYSEEEIEKMLKVLPSATNDYDRDYLIVELSYEAAARTVESLNLKLGDIDIDTKNSTAFVTLRSSKSIPRKIPVIIAYRKLVEYMARHPLRDDPDAYLFYSPRTKSYRMSYAYILNLLKKLCEKAGIRYRSPYKLRHSRATNLLMNNTQINVVQKMLGHTNIKTTAIYLSTIQKDLLNAAKKAAGLEVTDDEEETCKLQIKKCPGCGRLEDPLSVRCGSCGAFLDHAAAMRFEKTREKNSRRKDRKVRNEIEELRHLVLQQQKEIQNFIRKGER